MNLSQLLSRSFMLLHIWFVLCGGWNISIMNGNCVDLWHFMFCPALIKLCDIRNTYGWYTTTLIFIHSDRIIHYELGFHFRFPSNYMNSLLLNKQPFMKKCEIWEIWNLLFFWNKIKPSCQARDKYCMCVLNQFNICIDKVQEAECVCDCTLPCKINLCSVNICVDLFLP